MDTEWEAASAGDYDWNDPNHGPSFEEVVEAAAEGDDELLEIMQEKLEQDAQQHAAYISQKIKDCGLENHAFYFYLLPLNDAETEKKTIMQHVLDGDVDL